MKQKWTNGEIREFVEAVKGGEFDGSVEVTEKLDETGTVVERVTSKPQPHNLAKGVFYALVRTSEKQLPEYKAFIKESQSLVFRHTKSEEHPEGLAVIGPAHPNYRAFMKDYEPLVGAEVEVDVQTISEQAALETVEKLPTAKLAALVTKLVHPSHDLPA